MVTEAVRDLFRLWAGEGDTVPPSRRGPMFVGLQVIVLVLLVGAFLLLRTALAGGGSVGKPGGPGQVPAGVFVGLWASIPVFVHWFVDPPRRGPGLAVGVVAGLAAGALVGPLLPLPVVWSAFVSTALGVLVCGATFAAVTVRAHPRTRDETRP